MLKWMAIVALFAALPLIAAEDPRIQQGTALHDQGKYDEAIAIYKSVLADDPSNMLAAYEMAFSYQGKGDFASCRALLEPRVGTKGPLQAAMYVILGNCLDGTGESDKAIATYRKGLKVAPDDGQLLYNLALTLTNRRKYDEARELLKREVRVRPGHGSGHLLLAQVFSGQNFRAAAVAEYLRFLALEPAMPRSKSAAEALMALLNLGVERKDEKNISVAIDTNAPKGEGDYSSFEMFLSIISAGRFTEDKKDLSEFERTRSQVAAVVNFLVESGEGNNHTANANVPFFAKLAEKKLVDACAGLVLSSLHLEGFDDWLKANRDEVVAVGAIAQGAK